MEVFYVYILYSAQLDRYYVGHTHDLGSRLLKHSTAKGHYTSKASDWILKYTEEYLSRGEAMHREQEIKSKKSREYIEYLIGSQ